MRPQSAVVRQDARQREGGAQVVQHGGGGIERQRLAVFAQHQQAGDVVDLRIHQHDRGDGGVARRARGLQRGCLAQLLQDIGRGIDQDGIRPVARQRDRGLRARRGAHRAAAHAVAVVAVAVPLRKAAAGGRPQYPDACHGASAWCWVMASRNRRQPWRLPALVVLAARSLPVGAPPAAGTAARSAVGDVHRDFKAKPQLGVGGGGPAHVSLLGWHG
ncbi:hypothetical protein D3C72_1624790 [compost metagenome]